MFINPKRNIKLDPGPNQAAFSQRLANAKDHRQTLDKWREETHWPLSCLNLGC